MRVAVGAAVAVVVVVVTAAAMLVAAADSASDTAIGPRTCFTESLYSLYSLQGLTNY